MTEACTPAEPLFEGPCKPSFSTESASPSRPFRMQAAYHRWTKVLLGIPPLAMGLSAIIVHHDERYTRTENHYVALFWTLIAILVVYAAVLPKRYEIHTDSTIAVVTHLAIIRFEGVMAAEKDPPFENWKGPPYRFSTDFNRRVLVRRHLGGDVLVSPKDPSAFVDAVSQVAGVQEEALV